MNRTWTGGEAVARSLAASGVEYVWGIPGTHNLEIYAHLPAAGIRHVLPRHEQGAAFAADGYARATGRPGVCITTSGPAVLNAATALGQAWSDSVPVLIVSAGMPLRHPGRPAGYLHETKDLKAALEGIVASSQRLTSVEEIPVAIAQAFAAMASGRPRPAHLEIPLDVLVERGAAADSVPVPRPAPLAPDADATVKAAALLSAAERPAIIAGGGARGGSAQVLRVAELLRAPVVTTFNGKGTLPEDHPLSAGAGLHRALVHELVGEADGLLVVGSELAQADLWDGPLPVGAAIVRIDVDPAAILANVLPAVPLLANASAGLESLASELDPPSEAVAESRSRWAAEWCERLRAEGRQCGERWGSLLDAIEEGLGRDGILVGDSTMACYLGAVARVSRYRPGSFLYPTGYGTLGYGLPAAIGAKLGRPDTRVVALLGDGGIMFTLSELASAAALGIALAVVVVDNHGYGEIREEMAARGDAPHAVDLPAVDFPAIARGLGCRAVRVDHPDALDGALAHAFDSDSPTLLHVPGP